MKSLLVVSALAELCVGASLLLAPSLTVEILLGAGLGSPVSVLVGRVGGAALLSIGLSCWLDRNRNRSSRSRGLVVGLAVYNGTVAALLTYAAVADGMKSVAIWPTIILHAVLLIWCAGLTLSPNVDPVEE